MATLNKFSANYFMLLSDSEVNSPHEPVQVRLKAIVEVHGRSEPGDLQKYEKQIPVLAHTQTHDTDVVRAVMKENP